MPAVSKAQQKFFGIVRAIQKGKMAPTTPETAKAAADMKKGDVKKFASTKHKGLPEKKKPTFRESAFTNITVGNKVGQTFQHASGATITLDNTMSDPSDLPSQVTIDLGFGDFLTVDAPSTNEYGIAGITSSLGNAGGGGGVQTRQPTKSADEINQQLDASQQASGAETAKVGDALTQLMFGDTETSFEKAIKNLIGHIGGYHPSGPQQGELVSHVADRGTSVVDIYMKELTKYGIDQKKHVEKITKEYKAFKQDLRDSGQTYNEINKNRYIKAFKSDIERETKRLNHIKQDQLDLRGAKDKLENLYKKEDQKLRKGTFDKDGNYIPPGFEDAIRTDQIGNTKGEPQLKLDPTQKFAMMDLGYGPAMTDLGVERKSPSEKSDGDGNFTPADIPILGNLHSFATGGGEAKYVLDQANEIVDNANKNNNGVIEPGSRGSEQNPINTGLSFQTKKEWFKNIAPHLNITDQIKIKSASNPFNPFGDPQGVMGVKAVHSQISDLSKGVQLDGLGGINVNDTYAFRPDGFENHPFTKTYANVRGALGGDKQLATQNFATTLDANFLNYFMKTPGRKDPIVYIKTNFSKNELVKMWGKKKYNEVMKKLKSELNVNESKLSFKLIQQFKEGLPEKKKIEEEIKTNRKVSFPEMQKRIRDAEERRRNQKKESEKLYIDIKRKGIKFYDKKGTGRIKSGKKIYD